MKRMFFVLLAAGTAAGAIGFGAAHGQQKAGSTATYWMSAETASGMGAMGGNGGMAAAMLGGGRGASHAHNLTLQLGTGQRPQGEPAAEHVPPAGLKAGASLPLVTPRSQPASGPVQPWRNMEKPKGRMLIYWGCGERARAGQPLVVDFASMAAGKVPPAFANTVFKMMTPPSPTSSSTYGEWPNQRSQTRVPAGGSLVGAHVVKGNYTPQIDFTLAAGQDFLAPVRLTSNQAGASGSVPLAWAQVPGSQAWFASTMGSGQNGDFVMWSSSETQAMAMAYDYLAPEEIRRLVANKVLLPASASSCTVPVEVAKAAPQSMLMLTAFGGEANFSHPVRPARAPASWRPDWMVKLRTKSTHTGLLGMSMDEMMGGRDTAGDSEERAPARPESTKSRLKRGLGKILGN